MQDGFDAREIWPFQCLSCRHIWEAEYVVRHRGDGHGNETDLWLRNGVPVQPPWAESHCPDCDAFSIAVFPIGYLSHHPELYAPEVPAAEADLVAATPETLAEGPKETGGGHVLSRMVLISVVVLALLALAGFEAYEITIAAG